MGGTADGYASGKEGDLGSPCSSELVDSYNELYRGALSARNRDGIQATRDSAQDFRDKFEGVKCTVSVGGRIAEIDAAAEANRVVAILSLSLERADKLCSQDLIAALNEIDQAIKAASKLAQLPSVRAKAEAFRSRFAGTVCLAETSERKVITFDADAFASRLIQLVDEALSPVTGATVATVPVFPDIAALQIAGRLEGKWGYVGQ